MKSRALNDLRLARLERFARRLPENFPALLRDAVTACPQIVTDRDRFPDLGSGRGRQRLLFTDRNRERHLLRLEAIAQVLPVMLIHYSLVDGRVGRRKSDGSCDALRTYRPRDIKGRPPLPAKAFAANSIEKESGVTRHALTGALADLRDAEWLTTKQWCEEYVDEATGEKKHRAGPAIHTLTVRCFEALGITEEKLIEQQDKASERRRIGPDPDEKDDIRLRRARQGNLRAAKRARRPPVDN